MKKPRARSAAKTEPETQGEQQAIDAGEGEPMNPERAGVENGDISPQRPPASGGGEGGRAQRMPFAAPEEEPMMPSELPPSDRIRAGVTGHNVRYILLFGLAGVILAYLILAFFNAS